MIDIGRNFKVVKGDKGKYKYNAEKIKDLKKNKWKFYSWKIQYLKKFTEVV